MLMTIGETHILNRDEAGRDLLQLGLDRLLGEEQSENHRLKRRVRITEVSKLLYLKRATATDLLNRERLSPLRRVCCRLSKLKILWT